MLHNCAAVRGMNIHQHVSAAVNAASENCVKCKHQTLKLAVVFFIQTDLYAVSPNSDVIFLGMTLQEQKVANSADYSENLYKYEVWLPFCQLVLSNLKPFDAVSVPENNYLPTLSVYVITTLLHKLWYHTGGFGVCHRDFFMRTTHTQNMHNFVQKPKSHFMFWACIMIRQYVLVMEMIYFREKKTYFNFIQFQIVIFCLFENIFNKKFALQITSFHLVIFSSLFLRIVWKRVKKTFKFNSTLYKRICVYFSIVKLYLRAQKICTNEWEKDTYSTSKTKRWIYLKLQWTSKPLDTLVSSNSENSNKISGVNQFWCVWGTTP